MYTAERLKRHDLEEALREIEFQNLLKGGTENHEESKDEKASPSDFALLANTVIYLINKEGSEIDEIKATKDLDSVYKIIINQLIKKINKVIDHQSPAIDQFVPTD